MTAGFLSCQTDQTEASVSEGRQVDVMIPSGRSYIAGTFILPFRATGREQADFLPGFIREIFGKKTSYYFYLRPAVLLLPGFLGERDELPVAGTASVAEGGKPLGMWELTAMELARAGYASLRIDYRNSGKSPGNWQNISLIEQLEDVENALKWLRRQPHIDGERLVVLGLSQGGTLAAQISTSPLVKGVVLWSAAADFSWHSSMFPEGFIDSVMAEGSGEFDTFWGETVTMGKAYFESVSSLDALKAIAQFDGPVLSIAGSRDTLLDMAYAHSLIEAYGGDNSSLVILDADHTLDSFVGPEKVQEAISITVDWLDENIWNALWD